MFPVLLSAAYYGLIYRGLVEKVKVNLLIIFSVLAIENEVTKSVRDLSAP